MPPNELSDEEQMAMALFLMAQIEEATQELRKSLGKGERVEGDESDPKLVEE